LRYNSPGFRPNKREGIVGLGWNLGAGGAITRVINGVADETHTIPTLDNRSLNGLYYGIKANLGIKGEKSKDIFELTSGKINQNTLRWNIDGCEVDPDVFFFNVPGLSGKFYIQNNGVVKCIGNKPFKVNLSGFSIQKLSSFLYKEIEKSTFSITTDDGFIYFFGGAIDLLDATIFIQEHAERSPIINTWHLTKIISPTGQVVEYFYKDFEVGFSHASEFPKDKFHYLFSLNFIKNNEISQKEYNFNKFSKGFNISVVPITSATKTTYLDRIVVNSNVIIEFDYVENENKFYSDYLINNQFNQNNLRLIGVKVINKYNRLINKFELSYSYLGKNNKRLFLTSVQEIDPLVQKDINPYLFTYYDTEYFPSPSTGSVDHWGFWNSNNLNDAADIPDISFTPQGDVEIVGEQRDASEDCFKVGMLKEIVYPTLGSSRFFYDRHQYAKRLERRSEIDFKHKIYNE